LPVHWEDVIISYGCLASTEGIFGLLPTEWWEMQISARREWRGGREGKRRRTQLNRYEQNSIGEAVSAAFLLYVISLTYLHRPAFDLHPVRIYLSFP